MIATAAHHATATMTLPMLVGAMRRSNFSGSSMPHTPLSTRTQGIYATKISA